VGLLPEAFGRNAVDMVDRELHGILEILLREVAR